MILLALILGRITWTPLRWRQWLLLGLGFSTFNWPVLAVVVILKSIFSLKTFDQIFMLTNGGPGTATQTLSHYIYFNGMKYGQIGYAASVAWLMVIPMIFLTYAYAKFVFRKN